MKMVDKILVPIDGSEQAHTALEKSLEIAKEENADVTLLHVIEITPIPMSPYPFAAYPAPYLMGRSGYTLHFRLPVWAEQYGDELAEHSRGVIDEAMEKANEIAPGVDIESMILAGKPAPKILDVSEEGDYDLIVMGSTGLGDIGRFLMGSVSSRVKANSKIPVRIFNEKGEEAENVDRGLFT